MQCPHCGQTVSENAKFCGKCGKRILAENERLCDHCEKIAGKEHIYCPFCGYRMSPPKE